MRTLSNARIQALDLILLRGIDPISRAMQCPEGRRVDPGDCAHVGLAVTREVLDLPCLEPGRIYLWESTLSAPQRVWETRDEPIPAGFGAQLRDLELLIPCYLSEGGSVALCPFLGQRPAEAALRQALAALHVQTPRTSYSPALLDAFGVLFPELQQAQRPVTGHVAKVVGELLKAAHTKTRAPVSECFTFSSELAARVYARLGVFELPDPRLAAPAQFLNRTDLFGAPESLIPEDFGPEDPGEAAAPDATNGAGHTAFERHQQLQQLLRNIATSHAASVSLSDDRRIDIEFREDAPDEIKEAERWLLEQGALKLKRPRAPLIVGDVPPPLNISVLVSGTRGDVQPFIGIGLKLVQDGHRVRLATHAVFRDWVESYGLEFYPLGGDPKELIAYMVRTGGKLIPTRIDMLIDEVPKKRRMVGELIDSTWGACTQPDPDRPEAGSFTADAIIANPPAYGHYHVAEKLGVPLHMIMTLPWSPTRTYPHPLANMDFTRQDRIENWLSYALVDGLTHAGISDIIGRFRKRLGLPKIGFSRGADILNQEAIPFTYLWSPNLLPRPDDWDSHIDIANFIFFEQESDYQPPDDLVAFLEAGDPPIYVGFGSIVIEDPEAMSRTIFDALAAAGRRGIVSAGWAGLGDGKRPEHVFLINECPHDWLFPRCAAVCHHGGAGTTSTGLHAGRPTIIVPFFGDQFFWGPIVAQAGAGPEPIPARELDVARLATAFRACDSPDMTARAQAIGTSLRSRDGAALTVKSFYRHLPTTADGVIAYLGFDDDERQRLSNGEIVLRPLEQRHEQGLGHALAARIERPLETVYADCLAGRELELDPLTLAFGELTENATPADFEGAGFDPSEHDEIEALLLARPGKHFNLSEQELREFERLASRHPGWALNETMTKAVNASLAELLLKRYNAYRQTGLDGIAHYARAAGELTLPGDILRLDIPPDSVIANEFPEFTRALLAYPHHSEEFESRFYWVKQEIAGQRSVGLLHKLFLPGDDFAGMAMRWYYIGRGLDVAQSFFGLARQGDATLIISAELSSGSRLTSPVRGRWRRWRTRNSLEDSAIRIAVALRY